MEKRDIIYKLYCTTKLQLDNQFTQLRFNVSFPRILNHHTQKTFAVSALRSQTILLET